MGKKPNNTREVEPLFAPVATNDDDDVELAADGGPSTRFRDDPQSSLSPNNKEDGPAIKYRDEPESSSSVFDWGDDNTNTPGNTSDNDNNIGDVYQIDEEEFDTNATGFSPVSLHDYDSDSDEENIGSGRKICQKANNMLNQRVFDETTYNNDDDRIFVGGGWGRHGSQFSFCPNGSSWCCRRTTTVPSYSRGPRVKIGYSTTQVVCGVLAFVALVFGGGFIGYEAGLPVEEEGGGEDSSNKGDNTQLFPKHTHTKGQEWLEWIEHEKDEIHMPHFNMTFHKSHLPKKDKGDETPHFDPMTQWYLMNRLY